MQANSDAEINNLCSEPCWKATADRHNSRHIGLRNSHFY